MKYMVAGTLLAILLAPAFAAEEYWIVQNSSTKKCTNVSQKPTTSEAVVVGGDGKVYTIRTEAEKRNEFKVCTDQ